MTRTNTIATRAPVQPDATRIPTERPTQNPQRQGLPARPDALQQRSDRSIQGEAARGPRMATLSAAQRPAAHAGLLQSVETAVRSNLPWTRELTRAERQVTREYVLPAHMQAISEAARLGSFAVSFRPAGAATLRCLMEGAPAKGHDILEKTVKDSSIKAAYGDRAPEVMQRIKDAGIEGYVAHWGPDGIRGLYMRPDAGTKEPSLGPLLQRTDSGHPYFPVNVNDLENSLQPLKSVQSNWKSLPFTGDYDSHDLINFSGPRGHIPSDSASEKRALDAMNKAIATCDPARPMDLTFQRGVQHGPQSNYVAHMLDRERGEPLIGEVARPSLPVAMCNRGTWSIIKTTDELKAFYDANKLHLKESWTPGSQAFNDVGNGQVTLNRT